MLEKDDYQNDKPIEVAYDDFSLKNKELYNVVNAALVRFIFAEGWKAHKHYIEMCFGDDGK